MAKETPISARAAVTAKVTQISARVAVTAKVTQIAKAAIGIVPPINPMTMTTAINTMLVATIATAASLRTI